MAGVAQLIYPCTKVVSAQTSTGVYWVLGESYQGMAIEWTVYVTFDHTAAAGAVLLESAPDRNYAGTWVTVGSAISWSAIDKAHMLNATGLYQALRIRISSAVTSGTCDVWVMGANKT